MNLRNIAIIAHVDHGKTTLVDRLLSQSGTLDVRDENARVMDSNALEKERGITILAKNTAIQYTHENELYRINIVDTPGHADFGGEVERVLSMVDGVLLLVDAVEGPMPQTRFVTQKAFARGLKPIVVVNKIDRDGARPDEVIDEVFDLFDALGATDEQLDFPIVYASAIKGRAGQTPETLKETMEDLFSAIIEHTPAPDVDPEGSLQMQISLLDYSPYVGAIGVGRIARGTITPGMAITVAQADGGQRDGKILQVLGYHGLERSERPSAHAGDIVAITGIDGIQISDTICSRGQVEALPLLTVDEPTVSMTLYVNTSPFAGREGKYVTSRQLRDRLEKELIHNVALRVQSLDAGDRFTISGRGELHLAILLENMRREGFEMAVGAPEVIYKMVDGVRHEPYEELVMDVPLAFQGSMMEALGLRQGVLQDMQVAQDRVRLKYRVPSRGLIGFHAWFVTETSGQGLMSHVFEHFAPVQGGSITRRHQGVLVSAGAGSVTGYALFQLQARGRMFVKPQDEVYEGMVIGLHVRDNDLIVNATREKQLTNIRASGTDENIVLTPPILMTLEQAIDFIADDELVEITPKGIRLRKKHLKEHERKKASREG